MFAALDKIDLAATVEGRSVAVQTDHRTAEEIERDLERSVVFALTRVINAQQTYAQVHYLVAEAPALLVEALEAAGAIVSPTLVTREPPDPALDRLHELADHCFRAIALRTAAQVGTRDLAMALRMLEDQTLAAPPSRDEPEAYWTRVIELAALTGELLRVKFTGAHWVHSNRALVPFGVSLPAGADSTIVFPTNRAQRVIDDGRDESLFQLLGAAEEALSRFPDLQTGRLMPSLRDRRHVELDEVIWRELLDHAELPVVVCGIDGESTFAMIGREALERTPDQAWAEALANLVAEPTEIEEILVGDVHMVAVSGSFYAAEKLLDRVLLRGLHAQLGALYLAATPARGGLLLAASDHAAAFATIVRARFDDAGGRAISPIVVVIEDGEVTGVVESTIVRLFEPRSVRAETSPLSRRAGRK